MRPKNEGTKLQIYDFINEYLNEHRVSPSISEIAEHTNCAVSTVHKFLVRLEEEGYIERNGRKHIISQMNDWPLDNIPVIGQIACGKPQLAIEDIQCYLPINKRFFGSGEYFGLIANGDSMINVGIDTGDIVIVRKQPTAEEGQIIVAMTQLPEDAEPSATLKRFYKTRKKNVFRLHPENDTMEDIIVDNLQIIGIAVKVLKDLK